MEEKLEILAFAAVIALLTIASGYFLNQSGFEAIKLANISGIKETINEMISASFLAFLLISSIAFATIAALCTSKDNKAMAYKASFPGLAIGIGAILLAFGASTERIFLSIFLLLAVIVLIETAFLKKQEFKKFITFRTAANSTQKAVLIIAVGLFVSTGYIVSAEQEKFVQDFEQETLKLALNQNNGSSGIADTSADAIIQMQKQSLQQITSTSQFQKLETKQDNDVQAFVLMVNTLETQIDNPATKEAVKQQLQNNLGENKNLLSFDLVKKQIPFIKTIEEFYWLIAAISITSIFLFLANIVIVNLSGFFAAVISAILEKTGITD